MSSGQRRPDFWSGPQVATGRLGLATGLEGVLDRLRPVSSVNLEAMKAANQDLPEASNLPNGYSSGPWPLDSYSNYETAMAPFKSEAGYSGS